MSYSMGKSRSHSFKKATKFFHELDAFSTMEIKKGSIVKVGGKFHKIQRIDKLLVDGGVIKLSGLSQIVPQKTRTYRAAQKNEEDEVRG